MKKIPVGLNDGAHALLKRLAFETQISMSEHIRLALDEYLLKNYAKKMQEAKAKHEKSQ